MTEVAGQAGEAPGGALSRPPTRQQSEVPFPSLSPPAPTPPHSARRSPDGTARGAPGPGKGGAREKDGAAPGALTSALPAAAGAGPGGARARPAHPPARRRTVLGARLARAPPARSQVAQSAGGSRPPGPAPHPAHRSFGAARSGPRSPQSPTLAVRSPLSARRWCSPSRLRSAGAPSPERGQSSARTREGIPPPLCSPTPRAGPPCRDPQQKTDWSARPGSP